MKTKLLRLLGLAGLACALTDVAAGPVPKLDADLQGVETAVPTQAPNVPPPITRKHATKVVVNLEVRELAALLGVNFRKDANGQFAHSNLITVLNAEGEIIFQQPGLNRPADDIIVKLKAALKP
ncbi:MAG: hypothetical protein U1F65_08410 [Verrucomicrobiota bacterium]